MNSPNHPAGAGAYALPRHPLDRSTPHPMHTLELEGAVEAKLAALKRQLFVVLLADRPDVDGVGFTIDMRPGAPQPLIYPQRLPGGRLGKMALAFPAGSLSEPNRHAGIFDADGHLWASGVVLPTGKTTVFRLPSVRIYAAATLDRAAPASS